MSTHQGTAGTGALHYGDVGDDGIPNVLRGLLTTSDHAVYPDNYCLACAKEGVDAGDKCFHRHWNKDSGGQE